MNRHISSSFARLTVLLEAERRCRFLFANAAGVRENMVYFSGCVAPCTDRFEARCQFIRIERCSASQLFCWPRTSFRYNVFQNKRPGSRAWPFCEIFNMWLWHGPIRGRDHATHILQTNENSWKNASNNNSKFLKKKSHPIPWAVPQFAFFKSDQSTSLNILIFPSVAEHEKILKLLSILPK